MRASSNELDSVVIINRLLFPLSLSSEQVSHDGLLAFHEPQVVQRSQEVSDFVVDHVPELSVLTGLPVNIFLGCLAHSFSHLLAILQVPLRHSDVGVAQVRLVMLRVRVFFLFALIVALTKRVGLQEITEHDLVKVVIVEDVHVPFLVNVRCVAPQHTVSVTLVLSFLDQASLALLVFKL